MIKAFKYRIYPNRSQEILFSKTFGCRSAEHRMYAQMNQLTEAGAMISLAIELITSNIRHNYGEINFERHPRPVEVEGEDKH